jgi:AbrB family looped-hinge helix DNA binding protein
MALELTRLSVKGQVVIPTSVRKKLGLKQGMRFLVVGVGDTVVLRRLELGEETMRLKQVLIESRKRAEKIGFTRKEIERLIHETRNGS